MGEQKGRRPSGTSSQGLSSFPNQMSSYPVLSDSYLERLLGNLIINSRTSRTKGFVLFSEDEKALGAYVVWEGRVKLSIGSDNGKSLILTLAGRGAVLGLPETILGLPYAATAEVVEATKASFLCRDHLLRRLRDTEAAYTAAENLSAICYSLTAELKAIHLTQSAEQKMARFLLGLSPTWKNSSGQMEVTLTANQEEIGQMIGVCRETVARIISRFKRQRILELGASTLVIRDRPALEELAG
ncbi:MAG: Crp/Fnr family transcriptional regulator [Candidatus Acidiferrales bacterium]